MAGAETPENLEQRSGTWPDLDPFLGESFRLSFNKIIESICAKGWFWPLPPMLGDGKPVDLLKLFKIVMKKGGYDVVTRSGVMEFSRERVRVSIDDSKHSKIESSNRLMELGAELKGFLFESRNINDFKEKNSCPKRKRDSTNWGLLNWVIEIGKDPCDPVVGSLPDKSRWKLSDGSEELWKQILQFRQVAFLKKYDQKYQKMLPCIYDDDQTKFGYNLRKRQKQGNSSIDKHCGVPIVQAEVPEWTGVAS
ncbi:hypothetical protein COLO4_17216 [Corchorus olitorius]|uniref:ARID domain-containing protein n=1 Tax=Corchorus olitorius TaxID=93759 RepID=A0A1R3JDJ3_9ROSI|nr:hypothetical protein COLO4_17216 [Corchorus olitorius]